MVCMEDRRSAIADTADFVCKWNSCLARFAKKAEFRDHVLSHVDRLELDALLVRKSGPVRSKRSPAGSREQSRSFVPAKRSRASCREDAVDDIFCKSCKSPSYSAQNQIVMCDKCSSWYHQMCHTPTISSYYTKNVQTEWLCRNCKV